MTVDKLSPEFVSGSLQVSPVEKKSNKIFRALGITVIVLSIILFLAGIALFSCGIIQSMPTLLFVGVGLMGGSVLGLLMGILLLQLANKCIISWQKDVNKQLLTSWKESLTAEKEITTRHEDMASDMRKKLKQEQNLVQNMRLQQEELKKQNAFLKTSLEELRAKSFELPEKERKHLEEKIHSLGKNLEALLVQNQTLEQELSCLGSLEDRKVYQKEVSLLQEKITQYKAVLATIVTTIEKTREQLSQLKLEQQALVNSAQALVEKEQKMREQLRLSMPARLVRQEAEMKLEKEALIKEREQLEQEKRLLEAQRKELQKRTASLTDIPEESEESNSVVTST